MFFTIFSDDVTYQAFIHGLYVGISVVSPVAYNPITFRVLYCTAKLHTPLCNSLLQFIEMINKKLKFKY